MKKVFSIIGICFGIMIMIFGLLSLGGNYSSGTVNSNHRFGADFYTEEYDATATAANNTHSVVRALEDIKGEFNLFTICFGGVITCYFFCVLSDTMKKGMNVTQTVNEPGNKIEELPDL